MENAFSSRAMLLEACFCDPRPARKATNENTASSSSSTGVVPTQIPSLPSLVVSSPASLVWEGQEEIIGTDNEEAEATEEVPPIEAVNVTHINGSGDNKIRPRRSERRTRRVRRIYIGGVKALQDTEWLREEKIATIIQCAAELKHTLDTYLTGSLYIPSHHPLAAISLSSSSSSSSIVTTNEIVTTNVLDTCSSISSHLRTPSCRCGRAHIKTSQSDVICIEDVSMVEAKAAGAITEDSRPFGSSARETDVFECGLRNASDAIHQSFVACEERQLRKILEEEVEEENVEECNDGNSTVVTIKTSILVNCRYGYNRSVCSVLAYLMRYYDMPLVSTLAAIRQARPVAYPHMESFPALFRMERERGGETRNKKKSNEIALSSVSSSSSSTLTAPLTEEEVLAHHLWKGNVDIALEKALGKKNENELLQSG